MIEQKQAEALQDLLSIAQRLGVQLLMVGASARLLLLDWKYRLTPRRTTTDWDFGVRVRSWDHFNKLRDKLINGEAPLFMKGRYEHEFKHQNGTLIDLVPFGELQNSDGTISWPASGKVMNVLGFDEALDNAQHHEMAPGLVLPVVDISLLVVLKLFAFADRKFSEDLADVLFIFENYSNYGAEERIFDELAVELSEHRLDFDEAGPYLLGRDAAKTCTTTTKDALTRILDELLSDEEPLGAVVEPTPDREDWQRNLQRVQTVFRAFAKGYAAR